MKDYFKFWRHYIDFKGRSTITEFCNAFLWFFLTIFILVISSSIVFISCFEMNAETASKWAEIIASIFGWFALSPLLAITVRRLRDAGYSHKSFFWLMVPVIGMIALAARLFSKSVVSVEDN